MPLRDHFRPPYSDQRSWEGFHAQWPAMIVVGLSASLPDRYIAEPRVHLGSVMEVDVGARQFDTPRDWSGSTEGGQAATAVWVPPRPTLAVETELLDPDEYAIRVYDALDGRRLVAAIEIVSPSNKDRPDQRRAFVAKCAGLLRNDVSVVIVDLVTTRTSNLYGELLESLGQHDPALADGSPTLYAVALRRARTGDSSRLETWLDPLELGRSLPTMPLWLSDELAIPLDLEASYHETARALRLP